MAPLGLHLRHAWPAVLVLCQLEGRAVGYLRGERDIRLGLDAGAVGALDCT